LIKDDFTQHKHCWERVPSQCADIDPGTFGMDCIKGGLTCVHRLSIGIHQLIPQLPSNIAQSFQQHTCVNVRNSVYSPKQTVQYDATEVKFIEYFLSDDVSNERAKVKEPKFFMMQLK
jgi:hypothetical protein